MSEFLNTGLVGVLGAVAAIVLIFVGLKYADELVERLDHFVTFHEFRKPLLTREQAEQLSDDELRKRWYDPKACDERIRRDRLEQQHKADPIWQKTQKEVEEL